MQHSNFHKLFIKDYSLKSQASLQKSQVPGCWLPLKFLGSLVLGPTLSYWGPGSWFSSPAFLVCLHRWSETEKCQRFCSEDSQWFWISDGFHWHQVLIFSPVVCRHFVSKRFKYNLILKFNFLDKKFTDPNAIFTYLFVQKDL